MIKGINDRDSLDRSQPRVDFRLYKGEKKPQKNRFGKDLNDRFRLESKDEYLKKILLNNYQCELRNGSLYLSELTVLPAFEDIERSFACSMQSFDASGLWQQCDREFIYLRFEAYQDHFGHTRKKMIQVKEPCPVAGTLEDCPHQCSKSGNFYFYIPELLEVGLNRLGCLSVHSYSDLIGIAQKLRNYEERFGSIKTPPFASPQTFNLIPYRLSRTEIKIKRPVTKERLGENEKKEHIRTGKKADGTTWAIELEILPAWLAQWQNYQRLNELQRLGFSPSPVLLEQVYDVSPSQLLQAAPPLKTIVSTPKINEEQATELKERLKASSWTPQTFLSVLTNMGRDRVSDLTVAEFEQIKDMIDPF